MGYTVAGKNLMLDALAEEATHVSLHDGDPGENGANELSGGNPAYARQAVTFGVASNGEVTISNTPEFDVPGESTVEYVGFWDSASGGTLLGSGQVEKEVFGAQGKYQLTAAKLDLNLDQEQ